MREPAPNLRRDVLRRRRADRASLRQRTRNIKNLRDLTIEERRKLFEFSKRKLIEPNFPRFTLRDNFPDDCVRLAKRRSFLHEILGQIGREKIRVA